MVVLRFLYCHVLYYQIALSFTYQNPKTTTLKHYHFHCSYTDKLIYRYLSGLSTFILPSLSIEFYEIHNLHHYFKKKQCVDLPTILHIYKHKALVSRKTKQQRNLYQLTAFIALLNHYGLSISRYFFPSYLN